MNLPDLNSITPQSLVRRARKVRAKKKLGQNFFVDPARLAEIAAALGVGAGDTVVEIGPGLGFLTLYLAATGARVTAVELDRELAEGLEEQFPPQSDGSKNGTVEVVRADFLDFDLGKIGDGEPRSLNVIGNIPYQITSPIIAHLFGEIGEPRPWLPDIRQVVLTMQLEVARRLVARPGTKDYSQLTVLKDYYCNAEILFKVPPECFYPVPEVTSAVVRMTPLSEPAISCRDHKLLSRVIRAGFKQRRKTLKKNLALFQLSEEEIVDILKKSGINPMARAEDLSLRQFAMLTNTVSERLEKEGAARP